MRFRLLLVFALVLLIRPQAALGQLVGCSGASNPPTAQDDNLAYPGGPVVIDVLGNDFDSDGDILTLTAFSSPSRGTVQYTLDFEALVYTPDGSGATSDTFTYTITDGEESDTATVRLTAQIITPPPPPPPQARVWFDYHCDNLACFFTSRWENIDDAPRYLHWDFGNGHTTPPYYNSLGAFANLVPGTNHVTLTIMFLSGRIVSSGPLDVVVQTPTVQCAFDAGPTASLEFSTRITSLSNNGSDAYDYFWNFDDGVGPRSTIYQQVYQLVGTRYRTEGLRTITFTIKVHDLPTVVGECVKQVQIINRAPTPDFTIRPGDGITATHKVFFFGKTAYDEWFNELGPWEWNFGDGTFGTGGGNEISHVYPRPGNYNVTLKVTDNLGASGTVQKTVTSPDEPPVNAWSFGCTGRKCKFDASMSHDDSEAPVFRWNFGDGSAPLNTTSKVLDYVFAADGSYDVTLNVDDGIAQIARSRRVTTRPPPLATDLMYFALPSCRIFDSRTDGMPLRSNTPSTVFIAGRCGIPAEAKAVATNVTAIDPTNAGSLYIYPAGSATPVASAVDFTPARSPRANHYLVMLGNEGAITAFPSAGATGTTHATIDITGYFTDRFAGPAAARGPLRAAFWQPWRAFNTATQPPALTTGSPRSFLIEAPPLAEYFVPADADAAWVNVTAVNPTVAGSFALYPSNLAGTNTSLLNVQAGIPQANSSIIGLSGRATDDATLLYTGGTTGSTGITVDANPWFAKTPNFPHQFFAVEPCRVGDTRVATMGGPRMAANSIAGFVIAGNCGVPLTTVAADGHTIISPKVVVAARIINADAPGKATIGYGPAEYPGMQHIQYQAGDTIASTVIVGTFGAVGCCNSSTPVSLEGGGADVVLDVLGYFLLEQNANPVTAPDFANAVINTPITIDVVSNDTDPNGNALKLSTTRPIFNEPTLGAARRASDTAITYTPAELGTDSFDYEVVDSRGGASRGHVTVTTRATNEAPAAVNDTATAVAGVTIVINVLANDSDPNGEAIKLTEEGIVVAPALGQATRASDTSIRYLTTSGGTDVLTYEIINARGITARARLTITANRPPVARNDAVIVQFGTPLLIDVMANDSDADGDTIVLANPAIVSSPSPGTATVHTDGRRISFMAGGPQNDTFSYAVVDPAGARSVAVVAVSVNRPPVAVNDSFGLVITAGPADLNVTANDSDPDGDSVRLSANPFRTQPSKGTVTRKSDSTIMYTPISGATGTDTFTIEVTDTRGGIATSTVTITFCASAASITASPAPVSIYRGQQTTLTVVATGAGISYQWYKGPSPSIAEPISGANSPSLLVNPALTTLYWVRVSNACSIANSATATVTVLNPPPFAQLTFNCRGLLCDLSALNSKDDVSISSYQWSFSDQPGYFTGSTYTKTFPWGCHVATLTVRDNEGTATTTRQTIAAGDFAPQWPSRPGGVNIDTHALSYRPAGQAELNTTGNLNGILEPGERVVLEPTRQVTASTLYSAEATSVTSSDPAISATLLDKDAAYTAPAGYANCWANGNCYVLEAKASGRRATPHVDLSVTESTRMPGVTGPAVVHVGGSFDDVPPTAWYYGLVESMLHAQLTNGCGGGNYCPTAAVTRASISIFLLKAKYGPAYNPPACTTAPYADVPCTYWASAWIAQLKADGIALSAGNYLPDNALTRADLAPWILRTISGAGYQPPACTTAPYADVSCAHPAGAWISDLKARNIAVDCGVANQFCPEMAMNRVDAAHFMYRGFSLAIDRRICVTPTVYTSNAVEGEGIR